MRADRPPAEWQALAGATRMPLAAGENLIGAEAFDAAIDSARPRCVQPDAAKWGGVSGVLAGDGRDPRAPGLRYCPHYLGAGVGLLASAHLLAAAGGDGLLEVDANANALRQLLCGGIADVLGGSARLGEKHGLGVDVDPARLRALCAPG